MRTNPPDAATSEVLAGVVERVTFHNPESGFCVLRVKARGQRDLITVVGHAATISAGEFVQASGTWVGSIRISGVAWSKRRSGHVKRPVGAAPAMPPPRS
jgi:hypothetical protein